MSSMMRSNLNKLSHFYTVDCHRLGRLTAISAMSLHDRLDLENVAVDDDLVTI